MTIVRNEKGRIEAPVGGHDDQMMGLAIAHEVREQVVFPKNIMEMSPQYHFNKERKRETHSDYGEQIVIV